MGSPSFRHIPFSIVMGRRGSIPLNGHYALENNRSKTEKKDSIPQNVLNLKDSSNEKPKESQCLTTANKKVKGTSKPVDDLIVVT